MVCCTLNRIPAAPDTWGGTGFSAASALAALEWLPHTPLHLELLWGPFTPPPLILAALHPYPQLSLILANLCAAPLGPPAAPRWQVSALWEGECLEPPGLTWPGSRAGRKKVPPRLWIQRFKLVQHTLRVVSVDTKQVGVLPPQTDA